ncbi:MAG: N-acetyl-gamma-glutamyl-phosphate reductase [Robiginitomaculum sp.]|nr:MAG: N-acetyl-gamma-glutamyl-phosphate reductase [Robiginitomaculum sp.]
MEKLRTAVLGASGYTGAEAVRLIDAHPNLTISALTANRHAGKAYGEVYPHLAHSSFPQLQKWQDVNWDHIDVVFACLPHGASEETISVVSDHVEKIVDLSADFRLKDAELYETTYGRAHTAPKLLKEAVYGLSEYARDDLAGASLVACPGCYPTASLLALLPALELIDQNNIIIDAKSGVSGAGRKESTALLYPETAEGAHAYAIGTHRHGPEIDQMLSNVCAQDIQVSFTPHLVPMNRGMIATCYVKLNQGVSIADLRAAYEARYHDEPFVHLEAEGVVPHTRHVRASNQCRIGVFADRREGHAIIISVIDNLTKGSSGQAVQNLNIMMGWGETLGLGMVPVFP